MPACSGVGFAPNNIEWKYAPMTHAALFDSSDMPYVEEMFARFTADPASVPPEWKHYFLGFAAGNSRAETFAAGTAAEGDSSTGLNAYRYAQVWRERGHKAAWLNPLADKAPELPIDLKKEHYSLTTEEAGSFAAVYGGSIGVEMAAIREPGERVWAQYWFEGASAEALTKADKLKLYDGLVRANAFEQFLHKKFVGAKRFSVEGNDGVVPLLLRLIETGAADGVDSVIIGMAHRGRLNVLCNILHKPLSELFAAFADKLTTEGGPLSGDVKYHLGKVYNHHAANGKDVELQLLFNPSHLEAVNPSVLGLARAKQDAGQKVLPVLMHGDSAVAGQGIVAECNNLMTLAPYNVGGTLHIVINNQIGFTADVADAVSGDYCTDGFKSLGVPIIHVNADDIEACWRALRFAWDYRKQFGKDVVVDLVGYRRWGHNEGDDPTFTQPLMYGKIRPHPVPAELYARTLKGEGFADAELDAVSAAYAAELDEAFALAQKGITLKAKGDLKTDKAAARGVDTVAEAGDVKRVAEAWGKPPQGFVINDKVAKVVEERIAMLKGEKPLNWGAAETTAYACLVQAGISVRITGQDVQRGTFSHRHIVLTGGTDNAKWSVLQGLAKDGARVDICNSALSENAVMGFEYGYALGKPEKSLVIWEGQFGDFANGAQVVVDQFLSAAEAKWGQMNHLTLLLPHGFEGQGPEHSSARLERYLQLCAQNNLRVAYPSTPAQIFHLLRRQALHATKRPLIVMTPKSLLRNPLAVSPLSDLLHGGWQPVIADESVKKATKVVLCSGKVYYDLLARREADKRSDVALIRMEEFYPWPEKELAAALAPHKARDVFWVQEEPRNMGAWAHVREYWNEGLGYLHYIGRPASASPAVGTTVRHNAEQAAIVDEVFAK